MSVPCADKLHRAFSNQSGKINPNFIHWVLRSRNGSTIPSFAIDALDVAERSTPAVKNICALRSSTVPRVSLSPLLKLEQPLA